MPLKPTKPLQMKPTGFYPYEPSGELVDERVEWSAHHIVDRVGEQWRCVICGATFALVARPDDENQRR